MTRAGVILVCLSVLVGPAIIPSPAPAQDALIRQGGQAYQAGDMKGAIKAFTAALGAGLTGHKRAQVLWFRGACWHRLEQYARAEADFSQAIALNPNQAHYYVSRGRTRVSMKRYAPALADFDRAVRLKPAYVTVYLYRGLTRAMLRQYPAAVSDFTRAIQLDPSKIDAYRLRALAYRKMGRVAEANADLAKANQLAAQAGRRQQPVQTQTPPPKPKPPVTTTQVPAPDPTGLWYRRLYGRHAFYFKIIKRAGSWPAPHAYQVVFAKSTLPLPGYRPGTMSMIFTITGPTEARGMTLYIGGGEIKWAKCKFTFADQNTIVITMTEPDLAHALPTTLHRAQ
jgi:tetratricopeptide (TPR) repeat protein